MEPSSLEGWGEPEWFWRMPNGSTEDIRVMAAWARDCIEERLRWENAPKRFYAPRMRRRLRPICCCVLPLQRAPKPIHNSCCAPPHRTNHVNQYRNAAPLPPILGDAVAPFYQRRRDRR